MPQSPTLAKNIRWLTRPEIPACLEIERRAQARPIPEGRLLATLRKRNVIGQAIFSDCDRFVRGFCLFALESDHIDILRLSIDPDHQRQGLGRAIAEKLKNKLSTKRTRLVTRTRETNLPGQLFLRAQGFRARKIDRAYYSNGDDSYLFVYHP
jgi:[ribosomal protein S18]-alanine N-acetyltransferase